MSQHPLPPARHQLHLLIPCTQTINQEKVKKPEMRFNSQQIEPYCLGLPSQNPGLREVYLEPSLKRGSVKINMLKQGRNTQKEASYIEQPGLTYRSQNSEEDLEPSAMRGNNRTRALVSLYWSSRSLHFKESPNQISQKPT